MPIDEAMVKLEEAFEYDDRINTRATGDATAIIDMVPDNTLQELIVEKEREILTQRAL